MLAQKIVCVQIIRQDNLSFEWDKKSSKGIKLHLSFSNDIKIVKKWQWYWSIK